MKTGSLNTMTTNDNSQVADLYSTLKKSFDTRKVQRFKDQISYEVIAPIKIDCKALEHFFRKRFEEPLREARRGNLPVQMSVSSGLPLLIKEKVTKKLEVWSDGTIYLHLVKNRQEVERMAYLVGLDITHADFPPMGYCMKRLCGERGTERWTFLKRETRTKLEIFEEDVRKLVKKRDFSVLRAEPLTVRGVKSFLVEYNEVRSLHIESSRSETSLRFSVRDLFSKKDDILQIFDWFA